MKQSQLARLEKIEKSIRPEVYEVIRETDADYKSVMQAARRNGERIITIVRSYGSQVKTA